MIRKLHLEKYGKFLGRSFDFSPVTLFYGENEAGKTTLFDAVFEALCSPKGTSEPGKRLKARYGAGRQARLEFDGEVLRIPAADFLNLFAVRSGSISLEIEKNSEWMNHIKAELFSGGIDPRTAWEKLDDTLRGRGRGSLNSEMTRLREEKDRLEAALAEAKAARSRCLADEKRIGDLDAGRSAAEKEASRLSEEIGEIEESLRRQARLREERVLRKILADVTGARTLREARGRFSRFSREGLDELRRREDAVRRLAAETGRTEASREAAEQDFRHILGEKAGAEAEKSDRARALAEVLREGLVPREKLVEKRNRIVWRRSLLAAAAVLPLLGAAGWFLLPREYSAAVLVGGAAAGIACAAAAAGRHTGEDTSRLEEAVRNAVEAWRRETGEILEPVYEAVLAGLGRAAERAVRAAERFDDIRERAGAAEARIAALDAARKKASDVQDAAERELRALLDASGSGDLADYAGKLEERKNLENRLTEIEKNIADARLKYGADTDDELDALLSRRIGDIEDGVTEKELPDAELRSRENLLRERKRRLEELRNEEKDALGNFSLNLGAVRERFKGLPEKIVGLEKEAALGENRLDETRTEIRAAEIAKDIFASLAGETDDMLAGLSRDIGKTFSTLVAEERAVTLDAFSVDTAEVFDAGGASRAGENLSAGTRDAFLLAARLVLARKSLGKGSEALVVLDEPFMALDRTRTGKALAVLEEFRRAAGWQIVIFTKDEILEKQAGKVFGGLLLVHRLEG